MVVEAVRHGARGGSRGRGRLYLNVGHTGLHERGFRSWLAVANVRPVYLVHDLIPITNPEFCRAGEDDKHRERMRTVLSTGIGVIGNSRDTLNELQSFAVRESLPCPPSVASPLGADVLATGAGGARSAPTRPTFVALGTIEARKNHLLLLRVWLRLIERLGADAPRLLIIGQRGWECQQVFDLLDQNQALKQAVTEINRCDDTELADYLTKARALLFPSLAEGYGLPLVEALNLGVPVIASDLPVFRELAGGIPEYLDPRDTAAWERTIMSYADESSSDRAGQLDRLMDFRSPSWGDHFAIVESWLASL